MDEIVNRVAKSPLVSIDLEEYLHKGDFVLFDVKDLLHEGLILREKEFRAFVKATDWSAYDGKNVGLVCSTDAIVPTWAYMLLTVNLTAHANLVTFGDHPAIERKLIDQAIERCLENNDLRDKKVVIKGCSAIQQLEYAYSVLSSRLAPIVNSLMYGEPCSTVPIFKQKK